MFNEMNDSIKSRIKQEPIDNPMTYNCHLIYIFGDEFNITLKFKNFGEPRRF